jgi:hypothetical protein
MSLSGDQQTGMFEALLALPGNQHCADCNEAHPTWASVNNSVLVCFQCAGIHRSLGVETSQIKSGMTVRKKHEKTANTVSVCLHSCRAQSNWTHGLAEKLTPSRKASLLNSSTKPSWRLLCPPATPSPTPAPAARAARGARQTDS